MSRDAPVTKDDNWFIGEDKTHRFTIYVPGATEAQILDDTAPRQDMTGWVLDYIIRRDPESAAITIQKTTDDGITLTSAADGECEVQIDAVDTASLFAGVYFYTLRRNEPGFHNDLAHGDLVLQMGASR